MSISLTPIDAERFPSWKARCQREYTTDLIAAGETADAADQHAADALRQAFPGDTLTADHAVFDLVHDTDGIVGYLWIGRDQSGDPSSWWIWDVVVEHEHRGRGYGRQAMQLAEAHARAAGAQSLGLSVFGHNAAALRLYESVGYAVTTVKMRKDL